MPNFVDFTLFLSTAILLAIMPGPGIFYVLTRSLQGGRGEGYASSLGTGFGGLVHVGAGALGLSAILASSAVAFSVVKYLGAAYLIYLGMRAILGHQKELPTIETIANTRNNKQAFYQGITTEILNPKTALFFLSFIPQFVDESGSIVMQFILLGSISILLNTFVDVIVASIAGPLGQYLKSHPRSRRVQNLFTGSSLVGLGCYVALNDR